MRPRLASSVLVNALVRLAERDGGFGTVTAKGDATAGAVLILLAERGQPVDLLERLLQPDGDYAWGNPLSAGQSAEELGRFIEKRRRFDPDCWVVELDVASADRVAGDVRSLDRAD